MACLGHGGLLLIRLRKYSFCVAQFLGWLQSVRFRADGDLAEGGSCRHLQLRVIAYWHHPPYSKGSHDSDGVYTEGICTGVVPLGEHGVDLVRSAGMAMWRAFWLPDGHYGLSTTLKPNMIRRTTRRGRDPQPHAPSRPGQWSRMGCRICRVRQRKRNSGGPFNHPAMFIGLSVLGSMVLDVANWLDAFCSIGPACATASRRQERPPPAHPHPPLPPRRRTKPQLQTSGTWVVRR